MVVIVAYKCVVNHRFVKTFAAVPSNHRLV